MQSTHGAQLALFANYSYHGFITDRDGETLALEADHRRHAEIENAIRDLQYGVGLNHLPSGHFPTNAAWLAVWGEQVVVPRQLYLPVLLPQIKCYPNSGRQPREWRHQQDGEARVAGYNTGPLPELYQEGQDPDP